ncbi:sensor histidine kinase [Streptomyces sp. N2-109]|uniref:Sensor histidine kinase n=1 Tax=Streptomyces gossypii TaxID=2883101 RepID=A0ABT2K3S4_9ACTN|nr:sensor histidine kinase [Streptomyces gossypii]MCT2594114.1 sensor histidine kinase [Streptomyces gossypii]
MDQRPQPHDRYGMRALRRWNDALWIVFGLWPPAIGAWDESTRYWSWALLAVLAVCYALLRGLPGNALVQRGYPYVLVLGLGALSVLSSGVPVFVVAMPQFWIFARSPRSSIVLSGAAAVASVAGNILRQGGNEEFHTGRLVLTLIGYAASVLIGVWVHRLVEQSDERARRLSAELETAQQRLAEAHQRQGAADERERLAREIHDTLAQGFASIIVLAESARSGLEADPAKSAQQLRSIEHTARENFAEARVLVGSAPRSGLAPGSVAATLRRTLDRFAEDTGLTVDADLPDVECDQQTRIALLRCTQESLANVRKHAHASTVGVILAQHPYGIELELTDDGRGFVVEDSHGFGLDGMRKRLAELGGQLTVTSAPGDGTRVLATISTATATATAD